MSALLRVGVGGAAVIAAFVVAPGEALACGGCFTIASQTRSTQVTSHRMALSVSQDQTTLWDQIEYAGDPSEFAWVLPIHGQVDVGVSSDLFFTTLENATSVEVISPTVQCPGGGGGGGPPPCGTGYAATGSGFGGGMSQDESVQVLQQSVVGPYEQVQLASTDPMALRDWLAAHGYDVPADVSPIIDEYVAEGFDFLAVRLVPGMGIQAMQPIRVTAPGANLDLPLRMVGAGTGSFTAITLFVIGEGRYETVDMPTFTIDQSQLVWDFNEQRSNYSELREAGVAQNGGAIWLVESALPLGLGPFEETASETASDPANSGYGGSDPFALALADEAAAVGGLMPQNIYVTRLFASLPREALTNDLHVGASADQTMVPRTLYAPTYSGDPCLSYAGDCYTGSGSGSSLDGSGGAGGGADGFGFSGGGCSSGCAVGDSRDTPTDALLAMALVGLVLGRRRAARPGAAKVSSSTR